MVGDTIVASAAASRILARRGMVDSLNSGAVAISAVSTAEPARLTEELQAVRAGLPAKVLLIAGGAGGAPVATAMAAPGVMACNDLPSLRMTLARETARS